MICLVNGEPTPAHWISYLELGFNKPVELPLYPYTLRYDLDEVSSLIAEDYDSWAQETKQDNE